MEIFQLNLIKFISIGGRNHHYQDQQEPSSGKDHDAAEDANSGGGVRGKTKTDGF